MAHECFEDEEVAAEMNRRFVNIKVDREERPDVDSDLHGRGAGAQRARWLADDGVPDARRPPVLRRHVFPEAELYEPDGRDRRRLGPSARATCVRTSKACRTRSPQRRSCSRPTICPVWTRLNLALRQLANTFDPEWGGFGAAPKFPSTMNLDLVLRAHQRSPQENAAGRSSPRSLDAMSSGGMYDHIGGGFARYSVDEKWLVPHFEKMLYDQALLTRVYLHACLRVRRRALEAGRRGDRRYVLRDLRHPDGGFFSAEDADSPDEHGHGHEGLFHTWTIDEVREVLGDDADVALEWYEFTEEGNFEGRTIPASAAPSRRADSPTRGRSGAATIVRGPRQAAVAPASTTRC